MREIDCGALTDAVAGLCVEANMRLPGDVARRVEEAAEREEPGLPSSVLAMLRENVKIAGERGIPVCQDTGLAVVFLEVGQDVHFTGGEVRLAVDEGVRRGYREGYLRRSVVRDPLRRENTGDNTPAVLHTEIVPGDAVRVTVCPKGFGSENMSGVRMLTPSAGVDGVKSAVLDIVRAAGSNPCPPIVAGVGIGGDFEYCALLAKKALCRPLDTRHPDSFYRELEETLLGEINALGIGPQGFGGRTTALAVNIETAPTHIAGLPVAVNVGCHVNRHASTVL